MKKKVCRLRPGGLRPGGLRPGGLRPGGEGFARKGNKEFIQFLFISKSSAAEVQSQLYVALDQEYITQNEFDKIYNQAEIVSKKDSNFIKYLQSQLDRPK